MVDNDAGIWLRNMQHSTSLA